MLISSLSQGTPLFNEKTEQCKWTLFYCLTYEMKLDSMYY